MKKRLTIIIVLLTIIFLFLIKNINNTNSNISGSNHQKIERKVNRLNYPGLSYTNSTNSNIISYLYDNTLRQELITYSSIINLTSLEGDRTRIDLELYIDILGGFGQGVEPYVQNLYSNNFTFSRTVHTNFLDLSYLEINYIFNLKNPDPRDSNRVNANSVYQLEISIFNEDLELNIEPQSYTIYYSTSLDVQSGAYIFSTESSQYMTINDGLNLVLQEVITKSYNQGMNDAESMSFNFEWLGAIFDSMAGVLGIEIFNGFKLWYVVGVPAFLVLIYGVLKLFR